LPRPPHSTPFPYTTLFRSGLELDPPADSSEPAARLANLELAPPGCDPRRRAAALLGLGDLLGSESEPVALSLAGMNQLAYGDVRSEEHTSELQSQSNIVCR